MDTANTFGWQQVCARGGCSAKLSGPALAGLLASVHGSHREFEDASELVRSGDDHFLGLIDFAPPAHPDPYIAGEIAALNALSDLYATGATPCASLAICSVDTSAPIEFAQRLLAGLTATAQGDGAAVVGGHTMTGPEFLAGLAVVGRAGEHRLCKSGATAGCDLFLSKPLGTSSVIWAYMLELCDDAAFTLASEIMRTSNRAASVATVASRAPACTDVTGFGLLGHLAEMLAPPFGASIDIDAVPMHLAVRGLPEHVLASASVGANTAYVRSRVGVRTKLADARLLPLYDAQTNGGLLVAAPAASRAFFEEHHFQRIGAIINEHIIEIHSRD